MELPKLYKYRYFNEKLVSRNRLPGGEQIPQWHQVLYDGLIFPAAPESFNDPYDCDFLLEDSFLDSRAARDIFIDMLSSRCKLTQAEVDLINSSDRLESALKTVLWNHFRVRSRGLAKTLMCDLNDKFKEAKELLRVACFSENNSSILMWSHYAQNHTGFCIEYNLNEWDCKNHIKPVQYSNERHYISGNFADDLSPHAGRSIMDAALYKSSEWSYEKEWRLVMSRIDLAHPELKGLTPACFLKDYISSVYLGAKCKEDYKVQVCQHFKSTSVKIYQMEMETASYKLTPKLLN